jgi:RNA polymerase sigma-70 factor, ECF subfamily
VEEAVLDLRSLAWTFGVAEKAAPAVRRPVALDRKSASDEALCSAVAGGDEASLRALLERYRDRMYALLLRSTRSRADADDLFQELWMKVVRAAPEFDTSQRFSTWIYRIAVNLTRDAARRRGASHFAEVTRDGEIPDGADEKPLPDDLAVGAEEARALHAAIATLPAGQREVLVLRYIEGLGESEVAAAAGIPAGTVKSRLHHAVKSLRLKLAELAVAAEEISG